MFIETVKTQAKIAELLHELDNCQSQGPVSLHGADDCGRRDTYVRKAVLLLGKLMPVIATEMFPLVRADERDKVAYHIVAELVCCDIHEQLEAAYAKLPGDAAITPRELAKANGLSYHCMCRYGGWAAALAKKGPDRDTRPDGVTWWGKVFEPCPPPQKEIE